jgi:hypothetical protein
MPYQVQYGDLVIVCDTTQELEAAIQSLTGKSAPGKPRKIREKNPNQSKGVKSSWDRVTEWEQANPNSGMNRMEIRSMLSREDKKLKAQALEQARKSMIQQEKRKKKKR